MAYIIAEPCVGVKDTACVEVCPVDCIYGADDKDGTQLYIHPEECIDCGACEPACPVNAIFIEDELPEEHQKYVEINRKYFDGKDNEVAVQLS